MKNTYMLHSDDSPKITNLKKEELWEVFNSSNRHELVINVAVYPALGVVKFFTGDMNLHVVPLNSIKPSGTTCPDFTKPYIADCGQTVGFGDYEADAKALIEDSVNER